MSIFKTRPTNGVSYGAKRLVTAGDASDKVVDFDFRLTGPYRFDLVASVTVTAATTGVITNPVDLAIKYPSKGVVRVEGTFIAGSTIHLIAQAVQP